MTLVSTFQVLYSGWCTGLRRASFLSPFMNPLLTGVKGGQPIPEQDLAQARMRPIYAIHSARTLISRHILWASTTPPGSGYHVSERYT